METLGGDGRGTTAMLPYHRSQTFAPSGDPGCLDKILKFLQENNGNPKLVPGPRSAFRPPDKAKLYGGFDGNTAGARLDHTAAHVDPGPASVARKDGEKSEKRTHATAKGSSQVQTEFAPFARKREKSCPYIGVRKRKWGTFAAEIRNQKTGSREWLGTYDTAEEAAVVYDIRLRQIKGSKARCNFPELDLSGRLRQLEICPFGKLRSERLALFIPENWLAQIMRYKQERGI